MAIMPPRPPRLRIFLAAAFAVGTLAPLSAPMQAQQAAQPASEPFTLEQVKSYPFPNELTAAATGSRLAWSFNERGLRNVWVADAGGSALAARQLTTYGRDDGQEITGVSLSADGAHVVYVRGGEHGSNWDDAVPVNPASDPIAPEMELYSVPFAGGTPTLLAEGGDGPSISPRGDRVAFQKDGQIWVVPIDGSAAARRLFSARGSASGIQWSPDGSRLAFVSGRGDHSFIGVYVNDSTPVGWLAPSTSRDNSPRWSPDGNSIAFVRRPGSGGAPQPILEQRHIPWAVWTADVNSGAGRQIWESPATLRGSVPSTHGGTNLHWAANGRIVFLSTKDGWPHLYSLPETGGEPVHLTPGAYMAEHINLSPDRTFLVFAANAGTTAGDIDRRHIVRVPVDRALPEVLTPGEGLQWSPVVLGDGSRIAYIGAAAQQPPLPMVMPAAGGESRTIAADRVPDDFPAAQLVTPRQVIFDAPDGLRIHGQLFEPPEGAPRVVSGRRPAIVYVHGGPPRQMLLGWHYSDYYANAYALNQYLASQGYVVLSVNYRLGIGYGYEFRRPVDAGAQGAAEYQDVKAAGEYLRSLSQVDPARIGVYGGSYGGYLTALALGRDSDLFAAGVDIHGVHDFTSGNGRRLGMGEWQYEETDRERAAEVAWSSSPVSAVATWESPVLLIHADDDRNVRFSETVDLVQRLDAAGVPFEEIVIPDDTHHFMLHRNQMLVNAATVEFFNRMLGGGAATAER